jgi:serine/threonine-protein kinase
MLRQLNPSIPEPLEQIVLKVLAKEQARRYRTADQFGRVLVGFGQTPPLASLSTASSAAQPPSAAQAPSAAQQMAAPRPASSPDTGSRPHVVSPAPAAAGTRPVTPRPSESQPVVRPAPGTMPVRPASRPAQRSSQDFDWLTWLFVLLALIAVGGLVPFWFWVYYMLNPPL